GSLANLLGYQHDEELGATFLQVSNRQKVSGFAYGPGNVMAVELRLGAALSHYNDTAKDFLVDLRNELEEVNGRRPTPPPTA
ncbi:MAG TPA: hypothetical protein VLA54_00115, partial [Acidimicrobiia bacterium]|nr:hypothetical protein [Acidimicrobiia bacterium]